MKKGLGLHLSGGIIFILINLSFFIYFLGLSIGCIYVTTSATDEFCNRPNYYFFLFIVFMVLLCFLVFLIFWIMSFWKTNLENIYFKIFAVTYTSIAGIVLGISFFYYVMSIIDYYGTQEVIKTLNKFFHPMRDTLLFVIIPIILITSEIVFIIGFFKNRIESQTK